MKNWQQWYGPISPDVWHAAAKIDLLICDVDGVFSDGRIYLGNSGEELKAFHTRDGFGIKALLNKGIQIAVITGRHSALVEHRMQALGIEHIYQGQEDKLVAYHELKKTLNLRTSQIAYIGDDMVDWPVMAEVGLSCAVADGHPLLRRKAHYVTTTAGGFGAVREIADLLLHARGELDSAQGLSV